MSDRQCFPEALQQSMEVHDHWQIYLSVSGIAQLLLPIGCTCYSARRYSGFSDTLPASALSINSRTCSLSRGSLALIGR